MQPQLQARLGASVTYTTPALNCLHKESTSQASPGSEGVAGDGEEGPNFFPSTMEIASFLSSIFRVSCGLTHLATKSLMGGQRLT